MTLKEKWKEAVERKDSVLCAGLDPAEHSMDRGERGLPKEIYQSPSELKRNWSLNYVEAVAPYCAALKPNTNYWKGPVDGFALKEITKYAHELGMVVIEDSKLADIGSTNDAGLFYAQQRGVDAVTFSPFAGNMKEAVDQAHARDLGLIGMVLMSNPEYALEKDKLMRIVVSDPKRSHYYLEDCVLLGDDVYVRQYIQLAHDATEYELDGIVIGAPSPSNHIKEYEIDRVSLYTGGKVVLLAGVGTQGGEASIIWKYYKPDQVIVNVGRELMFPNGSNSTPEQQATKAREYQEMLNRLRKAA